jgi:hypothetical protein
MRQDDIKLNEAYSQIHSDPETLEEGILDRMGARLGSVGAAAAQRLGNVGAAWRGDTAGMVSHKGVYQDEKQKRIVISLVKAALNDISKLGLFGAGYTPTPEDTKDLTDLFNQFIADKRGSGLATPTSGADKIVYNPKTGKPKNVGFSTGHRFKGVSYTFSGTKGWVDGSGVAVSPELQKAITEDLLRANPKAVEIR